MQKVPLIGCKPDAYRVNPGPTVVTNSSSQILRRATSQGKICISFKNFEQEQNVYGKRAEDEREQEKAIIIKICTIIYFYLNPSVSALYF